MRRTLFVLAFLSCAIGAISAVPFLPRIDPPPPVSVVYPANWSNELAFSEAAVRAVVSTTNLLGACWFSEEIQRLRLAGDTDGSEAVRVQWATVRDALVRQWIENFRTNGIPDEYNK